MTVYEPGLSMQQKIHYTCVLLSRSGCTNACRPSVHGISQGDSVDIFVRHRRGDDEEIMRIGTFPRTQAIDPELVQAVSDAGLKLKEMHGDDPPVWTCDRWLQGACGGDPHQKLDMERGLTGLCEAHDPGYVERLERDRQMFPKFQGRR